MSTAARQLRLVVVTPETTLLDEPVDGLRFPLYDGQIGILPARAPLVGRLGFGELKISSRQGEKSYFLDGGFVQVKGNTVSLLTNRAIPVAALDAAKADQELQSVLARKPKSDGEFSAKERDQLRARRMLALARQK
jgi:F-type H+-transporting ATPase subunit epsilon